MAVNKVIYGNETLIDLTADTVTADKLLTGYSAHRADGAAIVGIFTPIDLSGDTVAADKLLSGYTAHNASGNQIIGTFTPIDLSSDTVIPDKLLSGYTAHNANGERITGTFTPIDLSGDTVTADKLLSGYTAHNANGVQIVGTLVPTVAPSYDLSNDTIAADRLRVGYTAHDANGQQITGTLNTAALEPHIYDLKYGYIDKGVWKYENPTNTYIDIYPVQANHDYYLTLGATVGTRFRSMFTTVDVSQSRVNVTGTTILNANDPLPFDNFFYTATANGYVLVSKDNIGHSNLKTYMYDKTTAWL